MIYARLDGTIVTAVAHPSMRRHRTVICQPLDAEGRDQGPPILAIDPLVAGLHQHVMISTDGSATRDLVDDQQSPLRNFILGIVDLSDDSPSG